MAGKNEDRRQVMIPPAMWANIQKLADHDMTSASGIIRTACKEYIESRLKEAKKKRAAQGGKMSMQQALDAAE